MKKSSRLSERRLSKKFISLGYRYFGVVDAVGSRSQGVYIDGKNVSDGSVGCIADYAANCGCCGDSGYPYYNCNSCTFYVISWTNSVPSSSFSPDINQGYTDANSRGFKTLANVGGNTGANSLENCSNCGTPTTQDYVNSNGDFGQLSHIAIKDIDRSLWTWGHAQYGQLGSGNTTSRSSPVQIGSDSWIMVAGGGEQFVAAIRSDFTLWTCGYNSSGQLGNNTTTHQSSLVQVPGSWIYVSCGASYMMGIKSDNTLWGWGANSYGQLGDGTTSARSSPVQVSGGGSWKLVSAGYEVTLGIKSDRTLYGWGNNGQGAVGDTTITNRNSPVLVNGGYSDWVDAVIYGNGNAYAIRSDYSLWGWGYNVYGVGSGNRYGTGINQVGSSKIYLKCSIGCSDANQIAFGGNVGPHFIGKDGNVYWFAGYTSAMSSAYLGGNAVSIVHTPYWNNIAGNPERPAHLIKYTQSP